MRVSWLNDNDAGVRSSYTNYAKITGMLEQLRHFDPALYRRLAELAADFRTRGPLYQAIASNYYLPRRELDNIALRVEEAHSLVQKACISGQLMFDLGHTSILSRVSPQAQDTPTCD